MNLIVSVDENWGIGYSNGLLERIPRDMKRFQNNTIGHTLIMGRKTYESLPDGRRPLPNRINIVITSKPNTDDVITATNPTDAVSKAENIGNPIMVIGGASIYKQLYQKCNFLYVTKIFKTYDNVDAYFPNLDEAPGFYPMWKSSIKKYNDINFQFLTYINRNNLTGLMR